MQPLFAPGAAPFGRPACDDAGTSTGNPRAYRERTSRAKYPAAGAVGPRPFRYPRRLPHVPCHLPGAGRRHLSTPEASAAPVRVSTPALPALVLEVENRANY